MQVKIKTEPYLNNNNNNNMNIYYNLLPPIKLIKV